MQQDRAIGATVRLRGRREADYWTGNWQVPATVAEGLYHIRLQNPRAREQGVSRLFRIGGGRPGPGDATSGTIALTGFPTTGETLFATHERRLSWRAPNASLRYRVSLMRHSRHVNHFAMRWMEAYNTRRNNWESGTCRIIVYSVQAPAIHASTPQFSTGNTSMPSER